MSSRPSLRKKLSFRKKKKRGDGAAPLLILPKSTSESTASCSPPPPPPPAESYPASLSPRRKECDPRKNGEENVSQRSRAHHLYQQQDDDANPKRRAHQSKKKSSRSSHSNHADLKQQQQQDDEYLKNRVDLKQQQQQDENANKRAHHSSNKKSSHSSHYSPRADNNNTNNKNIDVQDSPNDLWKQASALDTVGNTLLEKGHFSRAKRTYERALALKQSSLHSGDAKQNAELVASVATSINNIAYLRQRAGASAKDSMAAYQDALKMKRDILGAQSLSVGKTLNNIGSVHYSQRDFAKALSSYQEALKIMETNLGTLHLDVATVYSNIGDVYMATSDKQEALLYLKRALEIRWMHLQEHSPKIRRLLEKIALLEMKSEEDDYFGQEGHADDRLLVEEEHIGVDEELHLLSTQVEADIQQVSDLRRKMALDMVKDKLRILKGMRQIELQHDVNDQDSVDSAPSPESSVHDRGSSSKTPPPPLSPMERRDALSSVKERLAKLRHQKSLRSLMAEEDATSCSPPNSNTREKDDAEMEQKLGIAHLLEIPKIKF